MLVYIGTRLTSNNWMRHRWQSLYMDEKIISEMHQLRYSNFIEEGHKNAQIPRDIKTTLCVWTQPFTITLNM